ncbi:hypothetical protein Phum_PHUM395610 [Pediculus humanus corporis]|uniref:Uncharacterized protein n=1 Tax=Pediculus humanus subsp. corporis TaxID=121224 RepID=E0VR97_PEDHC|nr:uncharacterized protein Phum_PHUM395610 [Pediculus humanus corporis]EEB15903.1 hypothetical protein Phum_PHUM395610 [Pediculus humanus corporis]
MWNEDDSMEKSGKWLFGNWGVLNEYSPLIVGLACGFGVVLIVVTTMTLWKYCLLTATKKMCCRGTYGIATCQIEKNSAPLREKQENSNDFDNFKRFEIHESKKNYSMLRRSATVDFNYTIIKTSSNSRLDLSQVVEPLMMTRDSFTSQSNLNQYNPVIEYSKDFSKSTTALEDLYAKVNYSKKIKNRMRKDDAAIIAMSKSHSGNNNTLDEQSYPAIVVYDERTAL